MPDLLKALEWLARHGIIDIAFGLGIGSIILSAFRRRTVREIEGVEVFAELSHTTDPQFTHKSKLQFYIENRSGQPLYIYRALFRPKRSALQKSSSRLRISPKARINTRGWYLPFVASAPGEMRKLPQSLEHGERRALFITLAEDYSDDNDGQQQLEDLRIKRSFGLLMIYCICGAEQRILKTRI
jgi:hypothetical protein